LYLRIVYIRERSFVSRQCGPELPRLKQCVAMLCPRPAVVILQCGRLRGQLQLEPEKSEILGFLCQVAEGLASMDRLARAKLEFDQISKVLARSLQVVAHQSDNRRLLLLDSLQNALGALRRQFLGLLGNGFRLRLENWPPLLRPRGAGLNGREPLAKDVPMVADLAEGAVTKALQPELLQGAVLRSAQDQIPEEALANGDGQRAGAFVGRAENP